MVTPILIAHISMRDKKISVLPLGYNAAIERIISSVHDSLTSNSETMHFIAEMHVSSFLGSRILDSGMRAAKFQFFNLLPCNNPNTNALEVAGELTATPNRTSLLCCSASPRSKPEDRQTVD